MVRAEVVDAVVIDNQSHAPGEILELDDNTFVNLFRYGRVKHAPAPPPVQTKMERFVEKVEKAFSKPKRKRAKAKEPKKGKKFKGFR